ncbi:MAG: DUF4190 domain-containing protein [Myxococcota bacterium]
MRSDSPFGPVVPVPAGAMCPRHAHSAAVAACRRCGTFVCLADRVSLDGSDFCRDCAARPDVDYLEAFRLKYWGKRDSWAWFFGVGAIGTSALAVGTLIGGASGGHLEPADVFLALAVLTWAVVAGLFWAGVRAARWLLLGCVLLYGGAQVALVGLPGIALVIFPLAFVASALGSVRTKLFFKLDVPREQLRKTWAVLHDNVIARNALTLGVAGLLLGTFAPLAVLFGIVGLRRVDPSAYPPIGRKGYAIAGIVLGALGTLVWGTVLVMTLLER